MTEEEREDPRARRQPDLLGRSGIQRQVLKTEGASFSHLLESEHSGSNDQKPSVLSQVPFSLTCPILASPSFYGRVEEVPKELSEGNHVLRLSINGVGFNLFLGDDEVDLLLEHFL